MQLQSKEADIFLVVTAWFSGEFGLHSKVQCESYQNQMKVWNVPQTLLMTVLMSVPTMANLTSLIQAWPSLFKLLARQSTAVW